MTNTPLRILFAGSTEIASQILESLNHSSHKIVGVLTQPDRPAGRGRKLTPSPVKVMAEKYHLEVFQPETLRDINNQEKIKTFAPDVFIVVSYGLLLPKVVLDIPRLTCINVHFSLLPRWRGATPVESALLAGDKETGIAIMKMVEGLDEGPIYKQSAFTVSLEDNQGTVFEKMLALSAPLLLDTLEDLQKGRANPIPQDNALATFAKKIKKEHLEILWDKDVFYIDRLLRAYFPEYSAHTFLENDMIKITKGSVYSEITPAGTIPGEILLANKSGLHVATGKGVLCVEAMQFPGKKSLPVSDILNSKAELLKVGVILGRKNP